MKLIFATNNKHKIEELKTFIGNGFDFISLQEAGIEIDILEPFETLEENAYEKSKTIYQLTGENCFAEDTGLEVYALNGEPGVKSARYAGDVRSFNANIDLLLKKLGDNPDRRARFRTVISLILDGKEIQFEGICEGEITVSKKGTEGFGYDPIFVPKGADRSFGEMSISEKNKYNHRAKAAAKLVAFLQTLKTNTTN